MKTDRIIKIKFKDLINKLSSKGYKLEEIEGGKNGINFKMEKKGRKIAGFATKSVFSDEEIIVLD